MEMSKKDFTDYQKFYADSQNAKSGMCLVGIHPGGGVSVWDNSNAIVRSNRIQAPSSLSLIGWHCCEDLFAAEVYVQRLLSPNKDETPVELIDLADDDKKPEATPYLQGLAEGFTAPEEYNVKK